MGVKNEAALEEKINQKSLREGGMSLRLGQKHRAEPGN